MEDVPIYKPTKPYSSLSEVIQYHFFTVWVLGGPTVVQYINTPSSNLHLLH